MQKSVFIIPVAALVVGLGAGYLVGGSQTYPGMSSDAPPTSTAISGMHGTTSDAMLRELRSKTGDERDEGFIENMIIHHQSAVYMSQVLLTSTRRSELKQLAKDIIATQAKEVEMMQSWLKEWYGR